ncbi:MAG TPA: tRNA (adenosine(37)-N6)-threonylcarbamoyltransferase complex transferase subunit TsaD [Rectinemataceae bacterium]|nr:tRNA (adenosine(37)-N6)-threonylcarbamoyltransferase complex transferase subunit TsaD [Rectinemataceae bacterium]
MTVLGIESSCDECAAAVVVDGKTILSDVVASQIPFHTEYQGVVPELASRMHAEWIYGVARRALEEAGTRPQDLDGIAVTAMPGLLGSLLVGLSFAKGLAWSLGKPYIGVNHILAHLYAPRLEVASPPDYPFLGLIFSGGHSIICRVEDFDRIEVLGTTIDDAAGEAFDKVSKHYGFGYPGGAAIDALAAKGDENAFAFPRPTLNKGQRRYDLSYSGLKTAAIRQLEQYRRPGAALSAENIAASFRKAAIDMLADRLLRAARDTGLRTIVAAGGVAANSYLRSLLGSQPELDVRFPPLRLCGDNGAMVAGIGCKYLERGESSPIDLNVSARVPLYRSPGGREAPAPAPAQDA